jgi:hypothetical protein
MHEAAYENFEDYSEVFSREALITAKLMRITLEGFRNEPMIAEFECPSLKELYDMVSELTYYADRSYKNKKGIQDITFPTSAYSYDKDDLFAEMRTLLREEVQNYFGGRDESAK